MKDIKQITKKLIEFREARNWKKFHNPKDLALSLCLEASEVLEHFQWKSEREVEEYIKTNKDQIGEELADVFNWVLVLSHDLGIDITQASTKKIQKNDIKYPVEKVRGKSVKYNRLKMFLE
jgi:NTP pyrophosphatase (non-canonical NTP hydrolase)